MEYLDFELPIKELEDQLDKCQIIGQESDVDVSNTCKQIEKKLEETEEGTALYSFYSIWASANKMIYTTGIIIIGKLYRS